MLGKPCPEAGDDTRLSGRRHGLLVVLKLLCKQRVDAVKNHDRIVWAGKPLSAS